MKTIQYYGIATTPEGKVGQVLVTHDCVAKRKVSQEWTGVIYRTKREAYADLMRLNFTR